MERIALLIITVFISLFSLSSFAAPESIIIIRHGEKLNDKNRHLSTEGYQRAEALADEVTTRRFISQFGVPAAFFAASDSGGRSKRSIETVTPAAEALGLEVDDRYEKGEEAELVRDIKDDPNLDGKTVIISWAHAAIPDFLREFDIIGTRERQWDEEVFDQYWVLKNLPKGRWSFRKVNQALIPGDKGYCSGRLTP